MSPRDRERTGRWYRGKDLRHVAMPLGGLGAGQVALCGSGALRQWQIVNQVNHLGFVPDSFFLIRACSLAPPLDVVRILISRETHGFPADDGTPLVNDDAIPADERALLKRVPGVDRTSFAGEYPFARVHYEDRMLPLAVELEAYSPFVPLDAETSGLPAIWFTFRLTNTGARDVQGCLGATLQNAVGWDGLTPIAGTRCVLYGGNVNRVRRRAGYLALVMENPGLRDDAAGAGQMVLATPSQGARAYPRWTTAEQFVAFARAFAPERWPDDPRQPRLAKLRPAEPAGPSPPGETWNGGLLVPYGLGPGETTEVAFVLCWHFPNRYVNFEQFRFRPGYGRSRFWLGNAYAARFADATEVLAEFLEHRAAWEAGSRAWAKSLSGSSLPDWLGEAMAAQAVVLRSPTCFRTADGRFYGFEGGLGASTAARHGAWGGACPLNTTHVWNYEQALSRLFPALEGSMRETELEHVQAPDGCLPHRTVLPLYLPQYRDEPIGGPSDPALDGMLGVPLKVYRELRQGAGRTWLARLWPGVKRLMDYVTGRWDPDGDGVLDGPQPNTYDVAFRGPNMYMGGLWLAALRATEALARLQGQDRDAATLGARFESACARYDALLWNGEYYLQQPPGSDAADDQIGTGCLSDQLLGQWWAHQLELGYLLPEAHVRSALRSIVRYNFRPSLRGFEHGGRPFADGDDAGLLVCSWPHGSRPGAALAYADEVWTGVEYQVSAHCIAEGLVEEGLRIVSALRERYRGTRRNPYNEIECGDHYVRSLAGWSVLEALSGFRYDALEDDLRLGVAGPPPEFRAPFVAGSGWGSWVQRTREGRSAIELVAHFGEIRIRRLRLAVPGLRDPVVALDGRPVARQVAAGDVVTVTLDEPIVLCAPNVLSITSS